MILTTKDLQPMGYCARGARRWFEQHGLDWSKFVFEGLPEEVIIATGDPMAIAAVEEARRRAAEEEK
jgi:hypothetical protein